jgi:hypothetical protein
MRHYAIGEILLEEFDRLDNRPVQNGGSVTKGEAFEAWAEALDINSRILYDCHVVAREYTREEYERVINGGHVRFAHAVILSRATPMLRANLLERTVAEHWTVQELQAQVTKEVKAAKRGPGRSPAVPRNAAYALTRLLKEARHFERLVADVLLGERFDMTDAIMSTPPDKLTAELAQQVDEAVGLLAGLAEKCSQWAERLEEGRAWVGRVLERRREEPAD